MHCQAREKMTVPTIAAPLFGVTVERKTANPFKTTSGRS